MSKSKEKKLRERIVRLESFLVTKPLEVKKEIKYPLKMHRDISHPFAGPKVSIKELVYESQD